MTNCFDQTLKADATAARREESGSISGHLMVWVAEAQGGAAGPPDASQQPCLMWRGCGFIYLYTSVSTTWASDAIPQRKNQPCADRPAEVCLVAWIRTRKVAQYAASHSLKKPSFHRGHFGSVPRRRRAPPSSCLSQNGAGFRCAVGEALAVKPAPFLVSVRDNAMLPQRIPEPELGTAAGDN